MSNPSVLQFVKDLLFQLRLSSCSFDYSQEKIPLSVDLGLRSLLYGVADYDSVLKNPISQAQDGVIYRFFDEYRCLYVFLKFPNEPKFFFVGPYLNSPVSSQTLEKLFQKQTENGILFRQIVAYYNALPVLDDESMLFSVINTFGQSVWGSADQFRIEYVEYPIPDQSAPVPFSRAVETETQGTATLTAIERHYANEKILMEAVSKGELHKINAAATHVYNEGAEERLSDSLRNRKNYLIILNTLLRKSAETGGVHPYHIHVLSSEFANKIESVRSLQESFKLQGEMMREYCILVRKRSIQNHSFYVGKAVTLISYDLTADLSLKAVASALSVNPSYLSALFSKECGQTLTEYVREKRLEESARLLQQTNRTVFQIAIDCGFNDAHYFIRCFKRKTGLTPKAYRAKRK